MSVLIGSINAIILILVLALASAQAASERVFEYGAFINGARVYVFADKTELRATPAASSRVVATRKIGSPLFIVAKSKASKDENNYRDYWYEVLDPALPQSKSLYVWGGALAKTALKISSKPETVIVGIKGQGQGNYKKTVEAHLLDSGVVVSSITFDPIDFADDQFYHYCVNADIFPVKGLCNNPRPAIP